MIFFSPRLPSTCSSDRTDAPTRFAKSIVVRSHPSPGGTNRGVRGFTVKRGFKMLTRERPDFRTVDRWAIGLLLEAGAIQKCDQHGWAKDRSDPHPREEALRIAREDPLAGLQQQADRPPVHRPEIRPF